MSTQELNEMTDEQLLQHVRNIFEEHDIAEVHVTYSGSGDSGSFEPGTVMFMNGTEEELAGNPNDTDEKHRQKPFDLVLANQPYSQEVFDKRKQKWVKKRAFRDTSFSDYMIEIASNFVSIEHSGWENNDGARGTVTILRDREGIEVLADAQRRRLTVEINHVDYYQGEEESNETYTSDSNTIPEAAPVPLVVHKSRKDWKDMISTTLDNAIETCIRQSYGEPPSSERDATLEKLKEISEELSRGC